MVKKESFLEFLSISFLFCLGVLAFGQILSTSLFGFDIQNYELGAKIVNNILAIQYGIVVFAILSGGLLFYGNREKIASIEEEQEKELEEEEKRKAEFQSKFPRLSKIPVFGWIVKWMYGEGGRYSLGMIGILFLAFLLRIINLNDISFWFDEFLHITTIHGLQNGSYIPAFENGVEYWRSFPSTYLVYFMNLYFPVNEFYSRLPFVVLSVVTIFTFYFLLKKFFTKEISLMILFLLSIYIPFIVISKEVRYYIPLMLFTIIFFLTLLSEIKLIYKIAIFLILLYLGSNSSSLFLGIFFSSIALYYFNFNFNFIKKNILPISIFIIIFGYFLFDRIENELLSGNFFSKEAMFGFHYDYIISYGYIYTIFILFSVIIILYSNKNQKLKSLLGTIVLFTLLIFLDTKFSGALRHTTFLIPIIFIFIGLSLRILYVIYNKSLFYIIFSLILLNQITTFFNYTVNEAYKLETTKKYTWTRPDYKIWNSIKIYDNSIILATFPFITNYYTNKVNYHIPGIYETEDKLLNLKTLDLNGINYLVVHGYCIQIFTDYRERNDFSYYFKSNNFKTIKGYLVNYYEYGCNNQ